MAKLRPILFATVLLGVVACSENRPPASAPVTLPADADGDQPEFGLTEPRVEISRTERPPVQQLVPPPLSITAAKGFLPGDTTRVSELREVVLEARVQGAADEAELSLELFAPDGSTYEARSAKVGGDAFATYRVKFIVPVAGTAIDRSNLSGVWAARYLVAGKPLTEDNFELAP